MSEHLRQPGLKRNADSGFLHIYVSATGQDDNLGDSVLRRNFLEHLRPYGRLHVLVGRNSDSYVTGLRLSADDARYMDPATFRRACLRSALVRRTVFAFNTGEMRFDRAYLKTFVGHLPIVVATHLRGGFSMHVGYGIRRGSVAWRRTIVAILRLCRYVTWRDPISRGIGEVGSVTPDWAFGDPRASAISIDDDGERRYLVVSLRGDRAYPSEQWFSGVREVSEKLGLEVLTISQVLRDNDRTREIASELHCSAVLWGNESHAEWEDEIRSIYRRSAVVVSDRLHALIIGATEGAIPFGFVPGSPEKIQRTLSAVGLDTFSASPSGQGHDALIAHIAASVHQPGEVRSAVSKAAIDLASFVERIFATGLPERERS